MAAGSHPAGAPRPAPSADARRALDDLFNAAYQELRRLAATVRRHDARDASSATTLVNEAWLKLEHTPPGAWVSELHFKRIAARAMRQVLVEAARRRDAGKRGGGSATFVTLDESIAAALPGRPDLLALDAALDELSRTHPRQAAVVESRFFGGLDIPDTAALLGVSEATILRDWRVAKAWLSVELRRQG